MKWIRPSGSTIELADTENFTAFALDNGWKKAEAPKPKRVRRTKAQIEADNDDRSSDS